MTNEKKEADSCSVEREKGGGLLQRRGKSGVKLTLYGDREGGEHLFLERRPTLGREMSSTSLRPKEKGMEEPRPTRKKGFAMSVRGRVRFERAAPPNLVCGSRREAGECRSDSCLFHCAEKDPKGGEIRFQGHLASRDAVGETGPGRKRSL